MGGCSIRPFSVDRVDTVLGCGLELSEAGDRDGALAMFSEAIQQRPTQVHGYVYRADSLIAQDRLVEAAEDLVMVRLPLHLIASSVTEP
jgi:hypothetical protein